jgi:cytochrome c553
MTHSKFISLAIALFSAWFLPTPALADAAAGNVLYHTYCVSCHGDPPLGGPERAAGQPSVIQNAINTQGPMQFLRGIFSQSQLASIADYIASLNAPPPPPGPIVPLFDYSDLWWNPNESGWGFNLVQHSPSNNIFAVIYTYDTPKRPTWFVLPGGTWTSATIFTGSLYAVTGMPGNVPFNSTAVKVNPVGTATLRFTDSSHANFTYDVNGVQVSKQIERQPF